MSFLAKTLVTAGKPEMDAIEKWLSGNGGTFGKKGGSGWSDGKDFYSYKTVIARQKGKTLYVNSKKYSATTSKLQRALSSRGAQNGFKVVEKDEEFFGTSMDEKFPAGYKPGKTMGEAKKKFKMSKTYETYDEEAINVGSTDDHGFEYKDREFDSLWEIAKEIRDNGGTEPSSSVPHKSNFYSTTDPEIDYKTGEQTNYAFHPRLSSDEEAKELQRLLKMDNKEFAKAEPED